MLPETHISTNPTVTCHGQVCLLFLKNSSDQTVTLQQLPEFSSQPVPVKPSPLKQNLGGHRRFASDDPPVTVSSVILETPDSPEGEANPKPQRGKSR